MRVVVRRIGFSPVVGSECWGMTAGTVVAVDAIVLDYGVSGNGFYEVNAIDGAYGVNSPYAQIARWTGHPATGTVVNGRFGKLSGLTRHTKLMFLLT
jgi:hypothetical protein